MQRTKQSLTRDKRSLTTDLVLLSAAFVWIVTSMVLLSTISIELLSAVRAYVNGEALWSKAQKDSVLFLTRYGQSRAEADYDRYLDAIRVPLADHAARIELEKDKFDPSIARKGFLGGRNHAQDVDRMIWLFRRFGQLSYVHEAIGIWRAADLHIDRLGRLGEQLHAGISAGSATPESIERILLEIDDVNQQLTPLEDSFSQTLGEAARWAQRLLFWLLIGCGTILVVAGCATCYRLLNRIQESERKYRRLIDTAGEAIFISDGATGRMLESNRKAEEMLGAPARQFIGTAQPLLPEHGPGDGYWQEFVGTLHEGNGLNHEMRLRRADGASIPVEVSANLIKIGGRAVVQSIVRDLSARKRAEEALRIARDRALDASRIKGQFLANMSHEIRTPMNGVLGMITVLEATELSHEQKEFVSVAKDSAESLLIVINDILDFSRIEAGRLEINRAPFHLRKMAGRILDMLRGKAEQKGLRLSFVCGPDLPTELNGDESRLRQILTNLVTNAIKFTDQGSVTLEVNRRTAPDAQDLVRFEIRDTGIGIPAEAQARLFEAFSQADGSITRKYGGTGLGLAISRQLTNLMGGEIGVSSVPGVGSTFWFQVPLGPVTAS
jgi:PAS domain S-box-containing protein